MKIYLVKRTDDVDYDEYDSWVVVAHDPEEAKNMCKWEYYSSVPKIHTVTVKEIKMGTKPRPILGSFNAG